ncbi:hypothetical protein PILCRDRAFT_1655 [Piloderma croceum F 1598]|uniref:Ricin B lectin domain-containing protein n=1 Tax=Piloderma croceum (strain F 1598) TaxID=765440 RepID=A0A0C3BUV7_PILCF|nr:hypothetical protein PILCRDRAFT_1655 [Piloderma croceum F 1598]
MVPLDTGRYVITNRKYQNVPILPDANDQTDIVAGTQEGEPSELWNINLLSNGSYKIQNYGHGSFANSEYNTRASPGDGVVGGTRPQQWKIIEMTTKGDYWCVYSTMSIFFVH